MSPISTRQTVRLLQTSDVHIAGGFSTPKSCPHGTECLCPLLAIEAAVEKTNPDALLIVGDLFDHPRVSDVLVKRTFGVLGRLGIPVVLLAGNHDVQDETSPYLRHPHHVEGAGVVYLDAPGGSTVELLGGAVRLWAKAMEEHEPGYRPLHGIAEGADRDAWFVVCGHGHFVGNEPPEREMRSSPITSCDIAATDADYVALGHWHVTTDVSTEHVPAWYSGSPVQSWADGHVLVVDFDPRSGVAVEALPVVIPAGDCSLH